MEKILEEISIRYDLGIADQIIGTKMNSDGLQITSELKVCGRPSPQAVREITWLMVEMNKACDLANKDREPMKKKVVKKPVEKKPEPELKKKTLKKKKDPENEKLEISGGKDF